MNTDEGVAAPRLNPRQMFPSGLGLAATGVAWEAGTYGIAFRLSGGYRALGGLPIKQGGNDAHHDSGNRRDLGD
jgi:hypothetical protein